MPDQSDEDTITVIVPWVSPLVLDGKSQCFASHAVGPDGSVTAIRSIRDQAKIAAEMREQEATTRS
jgi:hypothetical protein